MAKISILYPALAGARFDMDYYLGTYMPLSIGYLGAAEGFRGVSVEQGLAGAEPGAPPQFVAMCDYQFDSVEAFLAAFAPHQQELQGNIPRYTDIEPVIQVNAVRIFEQPATAPSG